MKRILLFLGFLFLVLSNKVSAQYIIAEDNAGNYTTWATGTNQGFGFGNWDMWTTGAAGFFLGSSAGQGFGNIDVSSKSFGMYGNSGINFSNAQRLFTTWGNGFKFSIDLAIAFRNGNKGIDLFARVRSLYPLPFTL